MKISEMTFDQGAETMLRLAAPVTNICDDEKLSAALKAFAERRKLPNLRSYGVLLPQLVTLALKDHRDDLYEIIEALLGIPKAQIGAGNFTEIVHGLQDSWDEVLHDFFTRSRA